MRPGENGELLILDQPAELQALQFGMQQDDPEAQLNGTEFVVTDENALDVNESLLATIENDEDGQIAEQAQLILEELGWDDEDASYDHRATGRYLTAIWLVSLSIIWRAEVDAHPSLRTPSLAFIAGGLAVCGIWKLDEYVKRRTQEPSE